MKNSHYNKGDYKEYLELYNRKDKEMEEYIKKEFKKVNDILLGINDRLSMLEAGQESLHREQVSFSGKINEIGKDMKYIKGCLKDSGLKTKNTIVN